jgi:hypothetical protein
LLAGFDRQSVRFEQHFPAVFKHCNFCEAKWLFGITWLGRIARQRSLPTVQLSVVGAISRSIAFPIVHVRLAAPTVHKSVVLRTERLTCRHVSAVIVALLDPLVSTFRLVQRSSEQCGKLFFDLKAGEVEGAQLATRLFYRVSQVDLDAFASIVETPIFPGYTGRPVR